jgi:hypothetical protein
LRLKLLYVLQCTFLNEGDEMKKILGVFGVVAACAACCAIPFLPALAGTVFASGLGLAMGVDVILCSAVIALAIVGFLWLRRRQDVSCAGKTGQNPACSNEIFDNSASTSKKTCC